MFMNKRIVLICLLLCAFGRISAQNFELKDRIINGNSAYDRKDYKKAEAEYRMALSEDANSIKAHYNLGNALYQQDKKDEARVHYDKVLKNKQAQTQDKFQAYHNIGRTYLDEKQYEKAAQNFKEALKLNPDDDETRYNYALAKKKMEEEQQQDQGDSQDNQDSSEGQNDQNNQNSNSNQNNQDQEGQQNQEKGDNQNQKDQPSNSNQNDSSSEQNSDSGKQTDGGQNGGGQGQGGRQEITQGSDGKGTATNHSGTNDRQERMLDALGQQERETFQRIISKKAEKDRSKTEKDW